MNEYKYLNMFEEDVKNALLMIRDAHEGCPDQCCNGSVIEGEPPCEPFSDEWFDRVEEILYNQFQGMYGLADFFAYKINKIKGEVNEDGE